MKLFLKINFYLITTFCFTCIEARNATDGNNTKFESESVNFQNYAIESNNKWTIDRKDKESISELDLIDI